MTRVLTFSWSFPWNGCYQHKTMTVTVFMMSIYSTPPQWLWVILWRLSKRRRPTMCHSTGPLPAGPQLFCFTGESPAVYILYKEMSNSSRKTWACRVWCHPADLFLDVLDLSLCHCMFWLSVSRGLRCLGFKNRHFVYSKVKILKCPKLLLFRN